LLRKTVSAIVLTLLITSMLTLASNVQPTKANSTTYTRIYLPNEWISDGVAMDWHADDAGWSYTLPFDFPFYGTYYNTIYISSNGLITFDGPDSSPSNSISSLAGKLAIAPAWDDWRTDRRPGDDIYIWQPDSDHVVIRWQVVAYYDLSIFANFEAVLGSDGVIKFNYGQNNGLISATVGISSVGEILAKDVTDLNYINTILFTPFRPEHDLEVRLEAPTFLAPYRSTILNATVSNLGSNNETSVELQVLINGTIVDSDIIPELFTGSSHTLSYSWTPINEGLYNVTAYAPLVPDENVAANNVATKSVEVMYPLINPIEGQWANYTTYQFDNVTGQIIDPMELNFTYDYYISPYQINITMSSRDPSGYVTTGWMIANVLNRMVESDSGIYWTGMWYPGWIETNVTIGSTVNLLGGTATVVGSQIIFALEHGIYPIDCWELFMEYYGSEYTFWYDKTSGLWIGMEYMMYPYRTELTLSATNIPLATYEHELAVVLEAPNFVKLGDSSLLNATVYDLGLSDETDVELFLLINGTVVDSVTIPELLTGSSYTISYLWTPTVEAVYNTTAYARPVPDETLTTNNLVTRWSAARTLYAFLDDMEQGVNGWTATGFWHLITHPETVSVLSPAIDDDLVTLPEGPPPNYLPAAHSGASAWWYGEDATGTYIGPDWTTVTQAPKGGGLSSVYSTGSLTSPAIKLATEPAPGTLKFWSWWEIESSDAPTYDLMNVEISGDSGATWALLGVLNPTVDVNGPPDKPYTSGGYPDIPGIWVRYTFDITAYLGLEIQIRFRFDPRNHSYNGFRGWLIDDVEVSPALPPPEHDLAVSLVAPEFLDFGSSTLLNATVQNIGLSNETNVELSLLINGTMVNSTIIPELLTGKSYTTNYLWTPTVEATYNATAYALPVPDETITANNIATGTVHVLTIERTFREDFDTAALDPHWQVWKYGIPAPSPPEATYQQETTYSLTDNPGYLRYYLGSMTSWGLKEPQWNGPGSPYWYYPSMHLYRMFEGTDWILETKVTYVAPSANAPVSVTYIFFGDPQQGQGWKDNSIIIIGAAWDAYHQVYVIENGTWRGPTNLPMNQYGDTFYYRAIRSGHQFTLEWSRDGITFTTAFTETMGSQIDGLPQGVGITGQAFWSDTSTYSEYDYIYLAQPPEHELAVSLEAPSSIVLSQSSSLKATVYNQGLNNETDVELQLLINGTEVGSVIIPELPKGSSYTLSYLWTPAIEGIYNVTAYAPPVPGENTTANNYAFALIKSQHPAGAMWIEPAALNFYTASTNVGDKFNVTAWASTISDIFGWQIGLAFDPTQLEVVRAGYTGPHGSQWFSDHFTNIPPIIIDNTYGNVLAGENLYGTDVVHASSGSLFWIEFQILVSPTSGNTLTSLIDTNTPDSYLLDPDIHNAPGVALDHATYTYSAITPSLSVSISPSSASVAVNQSLLFTSNVSGGTAPYSYQWYLDGSAVSGANSSSWTLALQTMGNCSVYLNVTDSLGNSANSNQASVSVAHFFGDLNNDNKVDITDVAVVAKAFGSSPNQPRWNAQADVNQDGKVDITDVALVAKHFGQHYP
jgi:archaellum component FlaF (FlaF/FlaG flagellin family)